MTLLPELSWFFILGSAAIVVHEGAHLWYMDHLGRDCRIIIKDWKIQVGTPKDYKGLTRTQLKRLYLIGVLAGVLLICFIALLFGIWYVLMLPIYFIWCWADIKNAWRNR